MLNIFIKILGFAALLLVSNYLPEWIGGQRFFFLAKGALQFALFVVGLNIVLSLIVWVYRKRKKLGRSFNDNLIYGLTNISYIITFFAFILITLKTFGYDIRTVFTSLSIVAAAIAIISKDYLSSVISGIIISFSKVLSINDYVKIGELKGRIVDIGLVKIAMINEDDDIIFIPNDKVYTSEIINYTKRDINKVSIEFEMNISAIKSIAQLEEDIIESLQEFSSDILDHSYNLKIVQLLKDNIKLKFQYILKEMNPDLEKQIRKKTVRKIVDFNKSQNLEPSK